MSNITDDRTPYLDAPLPHPDNDLADDVTRLRAAFAAIDAHAQETRDGWGALAEEVETNATQTAAALDAHAANTASRIAGLLSPSVAPDKVWSSERTAAEIGRGTETAYHYDPATGYLTGTVETLPGGTRTTACTYGPDGALASATEHYAGITRATTYHYDAAGSLTGATTTEQSDG